MPCNNIASSVQDNVHILQQFSRIFTILYLPQLHIVMLHKQLSPSDSHLWGRSLFILAARFSPAVNTELCSSGFRKSEVKSEQLLLRYRSSVFRR